MTQNNYAISDDPLSMLTAFQLTRQEAAIYLSLLAEGEMNGYAVAKSLGLSRSNAYTSLAALVEKGAAWIIDGKVTTYTPVPPEEFLENRMRRLSTLKKALLAMLPTRRAAAGVYMTIRGEDQILDRLHHLLEGVEERVYMALCGNVLSRFHEELDRLLAHGKKVVIITDANTVRAIQDQSSLNGATLFVGAVTADQVRVIADSAFVLTGELAAKSGASCLFSDEKHLVDIFKTALRNEIRLIELNEHPEEV